MSIADDNAGPKWGRFGGDEGAGQRSRARDVGSVPIVVPAGSRFDGYRPANEDTALRTVGTGPGCCVRHKTLLIATSVIAAVATIAVVVGVEISKNSKHTADVISESDALASHLPNGLTFVSLGDWGRGGSYDQTGVGSLLGQWGQAVNAPFVVSVGDQFYQNGVASPQDSQFRSSWSQVYTHPFFASTPWYLVAGNHDYRGVYLQTQWTGDARWNFPSLYYNHTFNLPSWNATSAPRDCVRAVFIDTSPFLSEYATDPDTPAMLVHMKAANTTAQLQWLMGALVAAKAECKVTVVVGHHPLYSAGGHGDNPELVAPLQPLFDAHRVAAYIAGHDHTLAHLHAASTDYIISGAGSQIRTGSAATPQSVWFSDENGFVAHSFNATHVQHTFVGASGTTQHAVLRQLLP